MKPTQSMRRTRRPWSDEQATQYTSKILENVDINYADSKPDIKSEMMTMFEEALDKELSNLPHNCGIGVIFRFERVNKEGKAVSVAKSERCSQESEEWRTNVFERDGYKCAECGNKGKIQAHHIKSWAEHPNLRYEIDNGITLCIECHAKRHPECANIILNSNLYKEGQNVPAN